MALDVNYKQSTMSEKSGHNDSAESKSTPPDSILEVASSKRNYVTGGTFVSGASTELYQPIQSYEGRHRYDPSAEWTDKEEKRLVRRVSPKISWSDELF
jgi:hypothetical protein